MPESSPVPQLTLRRIELRDADVAATLSTQLGYPSTGDAFRTRIARLASTTDSQIVLVACLNDETEVPGTEGRLVGWIEAAITSHLQSEPFVLIGGLVVQDGVRGLGIGRRLCEAVETWTRENGIALLRVTSRSTRPDAHRFYLRDGYRETKLSKVFEKIVL